MAAGELPDGPLAVQFRLDSVTSSVVAPTERVSEASKVGKWLFWITAMVGFWATMSISIADITRYSRSQSAQAAGQLLGLPGAMLLYSFVSVFVTCAALIGFGDILVAEDAPWDPVTLIAHFDNPLLVFTAQATLLIATVTTNVAANVIAPANAFANLHPRRLSFRRGGLVTALIGVLIAPWWLFDRISDLLVFVSGLLGPVLGVMLAELLLGSQNSFVGGRAVQPIRPLRLSGRHQSHRGTGSGRRGGGGIGWLLHFLAAVALRGFLVFRLHCCVFPVCLGHAATARGLGEEGLCRC